MDSNARPADKVSLPLSMSVPCRALSAGIRAFNAATNHPDFLLLTKSPLAWTPDERRRARELSPECVAALEEYDAALAKMKLEEDARQRSLQAQFDGIREAIESYSPPSLSGLPREFFDSPGGSALHQINRKLSRLMRGQPPRVTKKRTTNDASNSMSRNGRSWTICFGGQSQVCSLLGATYIAHLLLRPNRDFASTELRRLGHPGLPPVQESFAIESLDSKAIAGYRARIEELDERIDTADANQDAGASALRDERARVMDALNQSLGHGGRTRLSSDAERARKSVCGAIRHLLRVLSASHRPLGEHLRASVHMGTSVSYRPSSPVRWTVTF